MNQTEKTMELLDRYRKYLKETRNEDENYKWDAIDHFQKNWDIEAQDFEENFRISVQKNKNLVYQNSMYFIRKALKYFPEDARKMFRILYDERISLRERIKSFQEHSEELVPKIKGILGNKKISHAQDERTISVYLAFRYPQKYYLYKNSVYQSYCSYLDVKPKEAGEKYFHFIELLEAFRELFRKNCGDILQIHREMFPNLIWDDTKLIIQNILYKTLFISESDEEDIEKDETRHYWLYAPGENAKYWDAFYDEGIMAIGWIKLGDLNQYHSKEQISEKLRELEETDGLKTNDAAANFDFKETISIGDIVIAKRGRKEYLGYGEVMSDYF